MLVADGMGDRPIPELGDKTPLEVAPTPNMDYLARIGLVGLCRTVPPELAPGSDVANMALLGADPLLYHKGRGPIEAAAQGLDLEKDDLIWRLNLVRVSSFDPNGLMRDYAGGHINSQTAHSLLHEIEKYIPSGFKLVPGFQYRHLLIQKNGVQSPEANWSITPPHDLIDSQIASDLQIIAKNPRLWQFLEYSAKFLQATEYSMQTNALWPWGQGPSLSLPKFTEKFAWQGAVVSAVDLIKGLGRASGMQVLNIAGATGRLDTDYQGKVDAALSFLQDGNFVFLHVEAPDEASHNGDIEQKIEAISRFDTHIVGPLLDKLKDESVAYLITCDHLTPIEVCNHTHDPVPFLLACPGKKKKKKNNYFNEAEARDSEIFIAKGQDLLPWAQNVLNKL